MPKPAYDADPGINFEAPVLYDAENGKPLRNATDDEKQRSFEAREPGTKKGIIEVDGTRCYVLEWPDTAAGADRRVDGPGVS